MRVIIDNDFCGDPDGLFQLAHILLSPSVDVRAIIGSHLNAADGFDNSKTQAENAAKKARELLQIMGIKNSIPVIAGSNTAMQNDSTPVKSEAVNFIIKEALRTDTQLPLYILCGSRAYRNCIGCFDKSSNCKQDHLDLDRRTRIY